MNIPPFENIAWKKRAQPGEGTDLLMSEKHVRPKILVVEDEEDSRSILSWLLEQEGYEIIEASDGRGAVETALRETPDLILMDISLPRIDGLQAIREIRAGLPDTPLTIIVMSAFDKHETREQSFAAGCDDYLPKPLDLEQLEAMIKRYLPLTQPGPPVKK